MENVTAPWFCKNRHGGPSSHVPVPTISLAVCVYSPLPSNLPSPSTPTNCTNMIRALVSQLFFPFPLARLLIGGRSQLDAGNHYCFVCIYKTCRGLSQSYLQTLHATNFNHPQIFQPIDELAVLHHYCLGRPVSGLCYAALPFDSAPSSCSTASPNRAILCF